MVATFIKFEIKVASSQINHSPIWGMRKSWNEFLVQAKVLLLLDNTGFAMIFVFKLITCFPKTGSFVLKKQLLEAITQAEFTFL